MRKIKRNLLLADDDMDDCLLFEEALSDLEIEADLAVVKDGDQLMNFLTKNPANLPDVLFLDLNMPRKSGIDCLREIKLIDAFKHLNIVIFSTCLEMEVVNLLYERGAHYFIRKPGNFTALKKVILKAINQIERGKGKQPDKHNFILSS